jgi:glycosyltransferase involved in cell wall biosynthesis
MTSTPAVSVVIPAYNAARWIAETIESVLAQTHPPREVIVVDDGSTDDLEAALAPYLDAIVLVRQDNAGCGFAFNRGIDVAGGDYVALCPADDLWVPEKLAWQVETLREHPDVDVSFTAAVNFGRVDGPAPVPAASGVLDNGEFRREMFAANRIPDPSVLLRRSLHSRLGGYVAEIGEDYEFWFRAFAAGATFHFDPRVTVRLRQHGTNLSSNAAAIWQMIARVHETHAAALGDSSFTSAVLARDYRRLARARLGLGDTAGAQRAYRRAYEHARRPADLLRSQALSAPGLQLAAERLSKRRALSAETRQS